MKLRANQDVVIIPDEVAVAIRPDSHDYVARLNAAKRNYRWEADDYLEYVGFH